MPTLPQKLEAIREACIAVNKSILDLKFGCRFTWNYDTWFINCSRCKDGHIFAFSCSGDKHSFPTEMYVSDEEEWKYKYKSFSKEAFESDLFEIIGRDILLSDVLAAMIDRIKKQLTDEYREDFSGLQGYIEEVVTWACNKIIRSWNLLRPSLDDQDEATVNLIYEILK
jgi:hypothetical protein